VAEGAFRRRLLGRWKREPPRSALAGERGGSLLSGEMAPDDAREAVRRGRVGV
jgi:hypothetical protein